MSLIQINNLSFTYDGSPDPVFENISFHIDTDWKLGFTGRNGRGKTTFLNLLLSGQPENSFKKYEYQGTITHEENLCFDYFPFPVENPDDLALNVIKDAIYPYRAMEAEMDVLIEKNTPEALEAYGRLLDDFTAMDGYIIGELVEKELSLLDFPLEALSRPFATLSKGEQTKAMLSALFLKPNRFLLIDEPTNHLDREGREKVAAYLNRKKGFILVSHDRWFLDHIVDHILAINRRDVEVQKGNFSSWQENKNRQDQYELNRNEKLKKDIRQLTESARQTASWSDKIEAGKIGTHAPDRGFIGHKAAKMMKRSKSTMRRQEAAAEEKSQLLKNIESQEKLKLSPLPYHAHLLAEAKDLAISYDGRPIMENITFSIHQGDRLAITGKNGSGKSSILKLLVNGNATAAESGINYTGTLNVPPGLILSFVPQETDHLQGGLSEYIYTHGLDEPLFKAVLRKLDFKREQFLRPMEQFSQGQKKKVLIAKSLCEKAHLYIWDEPLNFIDVISRMQIEELIQEFQPTLVFVEHDRAFAQNMATSVLALQRK